MLTVNEQLQKWFPQLKIEQLQPDGKIRFDFGNGSYEEMTLLKVSEPSSLAFTWDTNIMRFELSGTALAFALVWGIKWPGDGCKSASVLCVTNV